MKKQITTLFAILLLSSLPSFAQFYSIGDEDGRIEWMQTETSHYQIIYPAGLDSLSRVYARQLERYWPVVGNSSGYQPGEFYRRKTPVILHTQHGLSNGSVALAPMRMDLFTLPQAYNPDPMPWDQSLAVHESRHVSQMQFGRAKALKPFNWLLGEMFSGGMTAVYPNLHFLEGDAVVAETGLTCFGRGRAADFLQYYRVAWDEGDNRNWYQWRYGSYKKYAPNHYALGYLTLAGTRYCYNEPAFTKKYFDSVTRQPYRFNHLKRNIQKASGKSFKESFNEIQSTFHQIWIEEKNLRKPFIQGEMVMKIPRWFTDYTEVCVGKDAIYALKTGKVDACQLVKINRDGQEKVLHTFSRLAGGLYLAEDELWWSESVPDLRWSLKMNSIICHMDLQTGKIYHLTKNGKFFNPCLSPDRNLIAVAEYLENGHNNIVLLNRKDGKVLKRFLCPEGMQPAEFTWEDDVLYFNAITSQGTGLYQIQHAQMTEILPPQPVRIRDLSSAGNQVYFSSDRNGVNEFYSVDRFTHQVHQLTSLEYGGEDFSFHHQADTLYYTVLDGRGKLLYMTTDSKLKKQETDWREIHEDRVAHYLTAQEKKLAEEKHLPWPDDSVSCRLAEIQTGTPRPYRKGLKLFHLHSWAPIYIDGNTVLQSDFGNIVSTGGLGATAFFQSILGDFYGTIGYEYGPTGSHREYRSSAHVNLTYKGFYPVFNLRIDFGERQALQYYKRSYQNGPISLEGIYSQSLRHPSFYGEILSYIPFNLSSSGWQRGIVPSVSYSLSNDAFRKGALKYTVSSAIEPYSVPLFKGFQEGRNVFLQSLDASIRAYSMQSKAPANAFPRWGIEAQMGWFGRLGLTDVYSSSAYLYLKGYLPGIWKNQGIQLSLMGQHQFRNEGMIGENRVMTAPRGYSNMDVHRYIASHSTDQVNMKADYSIPIYVGDLSWFSPVLYIQNLELRPYADFSYMKMRKEMQDGTLFSLGSELTLHAANFLWVPYPTTLGITCCYNGGSLFSSLKKSMKDLDRTYIGFIMRVSL